MIASPLPSTGARWQSHHSPAVNRGLLAFDVPLFLARVRWLPVVVGEILAGIIICRSGLGLVGDSPTLEIFSTIGLVFLMFLAGIEIDLYRLLPARDHEQKQHRTVSSSSLLGLALSYTHSLYSWPSSWYIESGAGFFACARCGDRRRTLRGNRAN